MKNSVFSKALTFLAVCCFAAPAMAQSTKTAVGTLSPTLSIQTNVANEIHGLEAGIHIAQQKDIHVDISLECGLATDTTVKSKGKNSTSTEADGATAEARVQVQVGVYDETGTTKLTAIPIEPNPTITFCKRTQTLEAKLQGYIENSGCFDDLSGEFNPDCENLETEEIRLLLDTMNANAFNWVIPNLESGSYVIKAAVLINDCGTDPSLCSSTGTNGSTATSMASIGHGVMVLDEVRLNNN